MKTLRDRHPFLTAREDFIAGRLHSVNAIAMAAKDRDFIAEAELNGMEPLEAARHVVAGPWARRRVAALQSSE